ncbi:hypothetical protein JB92DRAFT_3055519, partial [Gautieria morchelliformis]
MISSGRSLFVSPAFDLRPRIFFCTFLILAFTSPSFYHLPAFLVAVRLLPLSSWFLVWSDVGCRTPFLRRRLERYALFAVFAAWPSPSLPWITSLSFGTFESLSVLVFSRVPPRARVSW